LIHNGSRGDHFFGICRLAIRETKIKSLYMGYRPPFLRLSQGKQIDAWHCLDLDLQKIAFGVE
jgi:hypothetical protein